MSNDFLYTVASQALAAVVSRFATEGISLPARQYVTGGQIALDCEQVVVEVVRVYTGTPGAELANPVSCAVPRSAEMRIWIVRCVPTLKDNGDFPTQAELDASGEELLTDGWVLVWGLLQEYRDGNFLSQCDKLVIGNLSAVGPEGGFGGFTLSFDADLTSWQK